MCVCVAGQSGGEWDSNDDSEWGLDSDQERSLSTGADEGPAADDNGTDDEEEKEKEKEKDVWSCMVSACRAGDVRAVLELLDREGSPVGVNDALDEVCPVGQRSDGGAWMAALCDSFKLWSVVSPLQAAVRDTALPCGSPRAHCLGTGPAFPRSRCVKGHTDGCQPSVHR